MKILVGFMVIIIAIVGFFFYDFISDEVQEAQVSQLYTVEDTQVVKETVDISSTSQSYTHRVSTYPSPSGDLLKDIKALELNPDYASLFYYNDDVIHMEYLLDNDTYDFGSIKGSVLLVLPTQTEWKTNLNETTYEIYSDGDLDIILITPDNTGHYQWEFDSEKIIFEIQELHFKF